MGKKESNIFNVKYSNKDIIQKIELVIKAVEDLKAEDLADIKTAQAVTNGTIKWHTKAIYAAFGMIITLAGWLIKASLLK